MVLIEGMTPEALLSLPKEEFDPLILSGEVVTFRVGTAEIVGQFSCDGTRLRIELGHIDGGGEGVLPTIASIRSGWKTRPPARKRNRSPSRTSTSEKSSGTVPTIR